MAQEKIIEIKVIDGDVTKATYEVNALGNSIDKVDKSSKKTGKSIKSNFDEAESAAGNLKGGVSGVANQFGVVAKAAKAGGAAMKSALVSTGIGLLIIALGEIVDNWEAISGWITGANEKLKEQKKLIVEINNELDRQKYNNELNLELIELQTQEEVKRAKLAGASEKEIFQIRRKGIENRIEALRMAAAEALKIERQAASVSQEETDKAQKARLKAEQDLSNEKLRLINFELDEEIRIRNEKSTRTKGKESKLDILTPEERQLQLEAKQKEFEELFDLQKTQQEALDNLGKEGLNAAINDENVLLAVKKKNADDYLAYKKVLNAQELALTKQTLNNISNVLGQTSAAGKAVAIATALINTYQGISAELATKTATPFEFGLKIANIASVVGIGFKAVKDIVSTKLPNFANSSGGRGGGGGSAGASPPSFNVVGNSGVSQIAQTLNQEQEPIEAYVVASNVSSAQEVNRNIVNNATLG